MTPRTGARGHARAGRLHIGGVVRAALVAAVLAGAASAPAAVAATATTTVAAADAYPGAAAAYVVTINGIEVWARAAGRALPPASLTKVMTALVVLDDWRPDAVVEVGTAAAAASGSRLGLRAGDQLRLRDAFDALLVVSANDACMALAEHVAGSVAAFVARMNARARTLGLEATAFRNPCGLDAAGHASSARDLHRLALAAMARPEFARAVALPALDVTTLSGRRFRRPAGNLLLGRVPGTIGVKTGFTNGAGKCLVAFVRRGADTVGVVLLAAPDRWLTAAILVEDAFAALAASRR